MSDKSLPTPAPLQKNIEAVAKLEQEFLESRTATDRAGDLIAGIAGTMWFVILHLIAFALWIILNAGVIPAFPVFDPYPFVLLTMFVSMEGVLLAVFILMKQNRMSRRAEQRDHLNLQIDLLAETEITKVLALQRAICEHFGIAAADDRETRELAQNTAVDSLARELAEKIPE